MEIYQINLSKLIVAKKIFQVKTQYAIALMCISNFVFLVQIERKGNYEKK